MLRTKNDKKPLQMSVSSLSSLSATKKSDTIFILPDIDAQEKDLGLVTNRQLFTTPRPSKNQSPNQNRETHHNGKDFQKVQQNHRNCVAYRADSSTKQPWFDESVFDSDDVTIHEYDLIVYTPRSHTTPKPRLLPVAERTFSVWDTVIVDGQINDSVIVAIVDILSITDQLKESLKVDKGIYACVYSSKKDGLVFIGLGKFVLSKNQLNEVQTHTI